jgi:alpha-mannosidase
MTKPWLDLLTRCAPWFILAALFAFVPPGRASGQSPKTKDKTPAQVTSPTTPGLHIISSSHQDIAWMDSPEKCIVYRDTNCITPALAMMSKDPAYTFTMENMLNFMEYIERHPDRAAEIARLTREGRMEWGATFNQPYESLYSGEQLVREAYFGRLWLKRNFPGTDARVYFNPDVPGRAAQMPQILSKSGIPYMVMSRYHEGLYRWASPDGSSVLAYSPGHYGNAAAYLNASPAEGAKAILEKLAKWRGYYASRGLPPQYPLLNSVDFSQPTDFGGLISHWNARTPDEGPGAPVMRYSTARRFFEAIDVRGATLDVVTGERPGLWLYIHGPTHHWAISAEREASRLLPAAEAFSTVRALLDGSFSGYPAKRLEAAWMAAIYPDHGWGGKEGQITDRLFRKKYEFARDEGRAIVDEAIKAITARIALKPSKWRPVVFFNRLSWPVTAPVVAPFPVDYDLRGKAFLTLPPRGIRVVDADGKERPSQLLPDGVSGAGRFPEIEFIADDVPALGYKTFYLVEDERPALEPLAGRTPQVVESSFYRVRLAPGGVAGLFDKELGREVLDTRKFLGFEVFTMRSVGSGAGEFGRVQQPTMEGFDSLSRHKPAWHALWNESGPVKTVLVLEQPMPDCTVRQKLIIYNWIKRIDCEVDLLGFDGNPYREYRLAVPVAAEDGQLAYEVPFGVLEVGKGEARGTGGHAYGNLVYDEEMKDIRPREVQNFLYAGGEEFGVTFSTSVAVNDYKDPTDDPAPYPVLQPILLASRRSCHSEGNWYLQEGDHHYRFSLTSHAAGWRNGYRAGITANNSLIAAAIPFDARVPAAGLPESKSFLPTTASSLMLATMKKAEADDAVILRIYDIEGKDGETEVRLPVAVKGAVRTNIIEEEGAALKPRKGRLVLPVGHHAVETLKLFPSWTNR